MDSNDVRRHTSPQRSLVVVGLVAPLLIVLVVLLRLEDLSLAMHEVTVYLNDTPRTVLVGRRSDLVL